MLMSGTLHRLLLAGTCLCVYGTPVHLLNLDCDGLCAGSVTTAGSETSETEHVTGLISGVEGGAGPHGRPEGITPVTQTENGDSSDGRSGPSEAGGAGWSQRSRVKKVGSSSEMGDAQRQSGTASVLSVDPEGDQEDIREPVFSPREQVDPAVRTTRWTPGGFSSTEPSRDQGEEGQTKPPGDGDSLQDKDTETSFPSSTEPPDPGAGIQKLTPHSPIPPSVFVSPQTSTHLSLWGHDGATMSSLPDPLLPEIGPNLMPREDGPESLWTEAARPGGGKIRED